VLSYPTLAEIEAVLERPLAPFEVLLGPDEADGFAREWRAPGDLAARNLGYAVQWFALALAAATGALLLLRAAFRARRRAAGRESVP